MINIEFKKSSNQVGLIKVVIVSIAIVCFIFWEKYLAPTIEKQIFETVLPMNFHGRVDSVYRDKANHNVKKVILSDGYVYGIYAPWEAEINLGDSLSKANGDLKVEVYKESGKKLILDYRQLVKGLHKAWWQR
jgi:hypothetical protein